MTQRISLPGPRRSGMLWAALVAVTVGACAPKTGPGLINDPYEAQNRENHAFNVAFDSHVLQPVSQAYGKSVPGPLRRGVSNFSQNLDLPSYALNDILQARFASAGQNVLRFAFNTVFGIGGIFDPAGALGLPPAENDFGRTLYVWGAPEGAYLEVPFLGPSTQRDLAGTVVDIVTDPVNYIFPKRMHNYPTAAHLAARVGDRYKYNSLINSILHAPGSYQQERLIYLEKRHHDLGMPEQAPTFDPYEDPYGK